MNPTEGLLDCITVFSGLLVYHLIVLVIICWSLFLLKRTQDTQNGHFKFHPGLGVYLILVLQAILFLFNLLANWINIGFIITILPITMRFLNLLSLIILIQILLSFGSSKRPGIINVILSTLLVAIFILSLVFWLKFPSGTAFERSWLDMLWFITSLVVFGVGLSSILMYKSPTYLEGLWVLVISILSSSIAFFIKTGQDLPGASLIGNLLVYPVLISIAWRQKTYQQISKMLEQPYPVPQNTRLDISPRVAASFLEVGLQNTALKVNQAVSHAVSLLLISDICGILHLDRQSGQIQLVCAYDLIREDFFSPATFDKSELPLITSTFETGKGIDLQHEDSEIECIKDSLGYNQLGDIHVAPVRFNGRPIVNAFLFLSPFTSRKWTRESENKFDTLSPTLCRVLDLAEDIESKQSSIDTLQISLNQSQRENQKLIEQHERCQGLLSELRLEMKNLKSNFQKEQGIWQESENLFKQEIEALNNKLNEFQQDAHEIQEIKTKNTAMEKEISHLTTVNQKLQSAMKSVKLSLEDMFPPQSEASPIQPQPRDQQIKKEPQQEIVLEPTEFVESIRLEINEELQAKDILLNIEISDLPPGITVDQKDLRAIMKGLLRNAIAASPVGKEVQLKLRKSTSKKLQELVIEVTDQGGGLSDQEQRNFFSMINRLGQPIPGGIGSIEELKKVLALVKKQSGQIWVRSGVAEPTSMRVNIPIMLSENSIYQSVEQENPE